MIAKPAVKKYFLLLISGAMWSSVGILLIWIASKWFPILSDSHILFGLTLGPVLGGTISWFGFNGLAKKNAVRILEYPKYVCIFAFQFRFCCFVLSYCTNNIP